MGEKVSEGKGPQLVNWVVVTKPMEVKELGMGNPRVQKQALLATFDTFLESQTRFVSSGVFKGTTGHLLKATFRGSFLFWYLLNVWGLVGDRVVAYFCEDKWLRNGFLALFLLISHLCHLSSMGLHLVAYPLPTQGSLFFYRPWVMLSVV